MINTGNNVGETDIELQDNQDDIKKWCTLQRLKKKLFKMNLRKSRVPLGREKTIEKHQEKLKEKWAERKARKEAVEINAD